jgi:hypothetical protein
MSGMRQKLFGIMSKCTVKIATVRVDPCTPITLLSFNRLAWGNPELLMRCLNNILLFQSMSGTQNRKVRTLLLWIHSCTYLASLGFPASDIEVHRFLTNPDSKHDAWLRAHVFLMSLLIQTTIVVRRLLFEGTYHEDLAGAFRHFMTDGQKMQAHNMNRQIFYKEVTRRAKEVCTQYSNRLLQLIV